MPASGDRVDPYGAFNFMVEIDGVTVAGFSEASGLTSETDIIEYRNGNTDIMVTKLPGLKKFTNITLKKGITGDLEFWKWITEAMNGRARRADGSIALLDEERQEVMRWNFRRGWPCKWTGPTLKATSNEVAIETLEICHEGLQIDGDNQ